MPKLQTDMLPLDADLITATRTIRLVLKSRGQRACRSRTHGHCQNCCTHMQRPVRARMLFAPLTLSTPARSSYASTTTRRIEAPRCANNKLRGDANASRGSVHANLAHCRKTTRHGSKPACSTCAWRGAIICARIPQHACLCRHRHCGTRCCSGATPRPIAAKLTKMAAGWSCPCKTMVSLQPQTRKRCMIMYLRCQHSLCCPVTAASSLTSRQEQNSSHD